MIFFKEQLILLEPSANQEGLRILGWRWKWSETYRWAIWYYFPNPKTRQLLGNFSLKIQENLRSIKYV